MAKPCSPPPKIRFYLIRDPKEPLVEALALKLDVSYLDTLLQQRLIRLEVSQELSGIEQPLPAFNIHAFETIPSTNPALWHLIDQGAGEGTVAIALHQQAGKGQWGRQWQSPKGGLYLSLALAPNLPATMGGQLTLCSAWGIAAALREYGVAVELKWPNDLVAQGRKLGGILTETRLQRGIIHQAVVGVGINWVNPVPETGINLETLLIAQPHPTITSLEMLAAIALQGIMAAYAICQRYGVEVLLPSYQALLTGVGHVIEVDGCLGTIIGVAAAGELRVQLKRAPLATAEVYLQPGTVSLGYGGLGTE